MAAFTSSAHVSQSVEQEAPPVPSSSEAMALDAHINGTAMQENSIEEFTPSSALNPAQSEKPLAQPLSSSTSEAPFDTPITDVTSGIKPLAPYLGEITHSDPVPSLSEPSTASVTSGPAVDDPASQPEVNGNLNIVGYEDSGDSAEGGVSTSEPSAKPFHQNDAPPVLAATGQSSEELASQQPLSPVQYAEPVSPSADHEMKDTFVVGNKVSREREDDDDAEPSAKRARTEDRIAPAVEITESLHTEEEGLAPEPVSGPTPSNDGVVPAVDQTAVSVPMATNALTENGTPQPSPASLPDFGPMTDAQNKVLLESIRNIRKSRSAAAFLNPVDAEALHIPHYHQIIKTPMDLRTMESKLKNREYPSVNAFIADFDTMVQNSITFNGPQHVVSQAGTNIRATLGGHLRRVPRAGEAPVVEAPKKQRKSSVSIPRESKARATRPSLPATLPATTAPDQTFALDHDGMPQIRRHSSITDGRPKREIHRPPPKDLPYSAKPKKKKFQQELRWCQDVLDDMTRPAYANSYGAPFMYPVDPVALNIPNYRNVIKKPMDMSTIRTKLEKGDYENAKEFEADMRLIFANCYKFNGKDHPVSKSASDLEQIFDQHLKKKADWLARNAPPSAPQSPEADSDLEDSEEEEDEEEVERQEQLKAINRQFAELSGQLLALQSQPPKRAKSVGKKAAKPGKVGNTQARRKSTSLSGAAALPIRSDKKAKTKQKAQKPITEAQKAEISEKIGVLTPEEMARAAEIIKRSLRKAGRGDLADRGDDEMEFEIDQIPDEALHELLKLVRKAVPPTTKAEDVDYRPTATSSKNAPAANQGKARKNKPMKGAEQDLQIDRVKAQLASFQENAGLNASAEGTKEEAESSGDESDTGSESEEE